jgi:tight adherence protein C
MLTIILFLIFFATVTLFLLFFPAHRFEIRPRLQSISQEAPQAKKKKKPFLLFKRLVFFNKPFCLGPMGRKITRELAMARVELSAEEFLAIQEIIMATVLILLFPRIKPDMIFFWLCSGFIAGYYVPQFWLWQKIKKSKQAIIKELPDAIDLLGLCVNAGLDFMLALKWVIEKSEKTILMDELNLIMQEINVGKPRRTALSDFAKKYDLPDLSTFTRTLIQADRMGTSVAEALNILSEDMRLARFRRGEQIALKAPMKMLIPLLLFIFPVVGILVGGPIFLDFMQNNPMKQVTGGLNIK